MWENELLDNIADRICGQNNMIVMWGNELLDNGEYGT